MCLIITGKSKKVRATLLNTPNLLSEIFNSNSDGLGYMYGTANGLKVCKKLPKNLQEAREFIQRMPNDNREIAIHARMTTHGHTDLHNCHPYEVVPGYMAMMHNGILHTGNAADKSKSDTWHFIADFLKDPLTHYPDLAQNDSFLKMIAELIENNRFVFMNGEGVMSHVNKDQGIEHDGMWFSNTYAWYPATLIPSYKSKYVTKYGGTTATYGTGSALYKGHDYGFDDGDDVELMRSAGFQNWLDNGSGKITELRPRVSAHHADYKESDYDFPEDGDYQVAEAAEEEETKCMSFMEFMDALFACDPDLVEEGLEENIALLQMTFKHYYPKTSKWSAPDDFSKRDRILIDAVLDEDTDLLYDHMENVAGGAAHIAEIMCYYFDWKTQEEIDLESAKAAMDAAANEAVLDVEEVEATEAIDYEQPPVVANLLH